MEAMGRRWLTALAAAASLLGAGGAARPALASPEGPGTGDGALRARIDRRIEAWQPTREERLLDQIGWALDLRSALRLAREHGRPLFLFTYDGSADRPNAIALQRC